MTQAYFCESLMCLMISSVPGKPDGSHQKEVSGTAAHLTYKTLNRQQNPCGMKKEDGMSTTKLGREWFYQNCVFPKNATVCIPANETKDEFFMSHFSYRSYKSSQEREVDWSLKYHPPYYSHFLAFRATFAAPNSAQSTTGAGSFRVRPSDTLIPEHLGAVLGNFTKILIPQFVRPEKLPEFIVHGRE